MDCPAVDKVILYDNHEFKTEERDGTGGKSVHLDIGVYNSEKL
jgi:hypothetical protein